MSKIVSSDHTNSTLIDEKPIELCICTSLLSFKHCDIWIDVEHINNNNTVHSETWIMATHFLCFLKINHSITRKMQLSASVQSRLSMNNAIKRGDYLPQACSKMMVVLRFLSYRNWILDRHRMSWSIRFMNLLNQWQVREAQGVPLSNLNIGTGIVMNVFFIEFCHVQDFQARHWLPKYWIYWSLQL